MCDIKGVTLLNPLNTLQKKLLVKRLSLYWLETPMYYAGNMGLVQLQLLYNGKLVKIGSRWEMLLKCHYLLYVERL